MIYYEESIHAILEGWKLLGIHMCLEGFLSLLWTRKQKYLHLQGDIMPPIIFILFYKVVLSKFKLPPDGTSTHANIFIWAQ